MGKYKTCRRENNPGEAHALTFSCFRRQRFLAGEHARKWLLGALDRAKQQHQFDLWAYVIMPEHVHLLVWPRASEYSMSRFLEDLKRPVARQAVAFVRGTSPLFLERMADRQPNGKVAYRFWQRGGGYDRNLTEPATIQKELDYIHANPVRRRLAAHPEDWTWSSAGFYAGTTEPPLRPDAESLPW